MQVFSLEKFIKWGKEVRGWDDEWLNDVIRTHSLEEKVGWSREEMEKHFVRVDDWYDDLLVLFLKSCMVG